MVTIADRPLVELSGVSKSFGGIDALSAVDVVVRQGTVHALVGENGAGKSTLGKIIAGAMPADDGRVVVDGEDVHFSTPRQALRRGIAMIAQELALVPEATVIQNVYLGIEDRTASVLRPRRLRRRYRELIERTGFEELPRDAVVSALNVSDQQKVEILRAVARDARVIVMDEPTARLSAPEAARLREIVLGLRSHGTTVVYVSHFLDEVLSISDTVTVLRDGKLVGTEPATSMSVERLVQMMVGRTVQLHAKPPSAGSASGGEAVLEVEGLTKAGTFRDVSFTVRAGEVVALAGLVGAGRSEVAHSIFGTTPFDDGTVAVDGREVRPRHPRHAIAAGIALLPEDRKAQGLVMGQSVARNATLPLLERFSTWGVLRAPRERSYALDTCRKVGVNTRHLVAPVSALSGGNQQRVLFGKWLGVEPKVLIIDEPTRGVDVAAKAAIYDVIRDYAASGAAILLISSEFEEVYALADRVIVMRAGSLVAEFAGATISEEAIARAALGAPPVASRFEQAEEGP